MDVFYKIVFYLLLILSVSSCNFGDSEIYPDKVSHLDGFWDTNSKYEIEIEKFEGFPDQIQQNISTHLIDRVGKKLFSEFEFVSGLISSNTAINGINDRSMISYIFEGDKPQTKQKYNFPVYSVAFQFSKLERGIEKYDLTLMLDSEGIVLKEIAFPKLDSLSRVKEFISLDSVKVLIEERSILERPLEISIHYNSIKESLFYYITSHVKGDFLDEGCLPIYKHQFKVNVITGEIVIYSDNLIDYY